jgi:hypothetical protein
MSASDDLMASLGLFIEGGHSFVFAPYDGYAMKVQVSVSGPCGSRSNLGSTLPEALEGLIVQIVEARLMGETPMPASLREKLKTAFTG